MNGVGLDDLVAPGTDPDVVAAVLGWLLQPRRTASGLRRRLLAATDTDALGPGHDIGGRDVGGRSPAADLLAAAGPPPRAIRAGLGEVARVWRRAGVRVSVVGDPAYPARLVMGWPHLDVPLLLAWRGELASHPPAVAIVGARQASGYGTGVAAWLAAAVSAAGVVVVSGGALGVDAAAHAAALEERAGTVVVLGCGHDIAYPRAHAAAGGLFDRVLAAGGALVSELLPWQPASPGHVRARNRIVAGLADAVVVVEGGARSGSLLTATAAADRGLPVLAVPGDVRAPGSVAPHRLLQEGAAPCTEPADVLLALPGGGPVGAADGAGGPPTSTSASAGTTGEAARVDVGPLPADLAALLAAAWPRPLRVDELASRSGRPTGSVLAVVTRARVAGVLAESADGVRLRRGPR